MIDNISCVIIAKNAEYTLGSVLDALNEFEDIVVYSNNSSDNTESIAKRYSNVNFVDGQFSGFGPTKNIAGTYAKNDWIFSLDADEVVSIEFIANLMKVTLENNKVYSILRTNYYKNTMIRYCWGDDIIVRLYNRKFTSFTDKKVHEKIIVEGLSQIQLIGPVKHFPYSTITDFIVKLDRYSTLFANDNAGKKSSSPSKAILNGFYSFIKTYFFKRGFLDGYAGLVIAFSHMATNFYKYIKLYEKNLELKK